MLCLRRRAAGCVRASLLPAVDTNDPHQTQNLRTRVPLVRSFREPFLTPRSDAVNQTEHMKQRFSAVAYSKDRNLHSLIRNQSINYLTLSQVNRSK